MTDRPVILACPLPRTLPLLFAPDLLHALYDRYDVVETTDETLPSLPDETLREARYIIGQPPLAPELLARMEQLRCIFNVESNLLPNMPYEDAFARGVHVVTTGAVFAEPVAEIGLGFALSLARNIHGADADFRRGEEKWGGGGNETARLLTGSVIGILGLGTLGQAVARVLQGFRPRPHFPPGRQPPPALVGSRQPGNSDCGSGCIPYRYSGHYRGGRVNARLPGESTVAGHV